MGKTIKKNDEDINYETYKKLKKQHKIRMTARKLKTLKGQRKMAEEGNI